MDEPQFFQTGMGQEFYTRTLPEIADQLRRLTELLQRLVAVAESSVTKSEELRSQSPR